MKKEHCTVGKMLACTCGSICGMPEGAPTTSRFPLEYAFIGGGVVNVDKPSDNVVLPEHYARFKIEPITFICENKLDFFQGNVVKYVCRHDAKNGVEDIKKAIRYLQMYVKYLQGDPNWGAK